MSLFSAEPEKDFFLLTPARNGIKFYTYHGTMKFGIKGASVKEW